jgi:hypothetical protein
VLRGKVVKECGVLLRHGVWCAEPICDRWPWSYCVYHAAKFNEVADRKLAMWKKDNEAKAARNYDPSGPGSPWVFDADGYRQPRRGTR